MPGMSHAAITQRQMGSGPVPWAEVLALVGHDTTATGRLYSLPLAEARKIAAWKDALADTPGSSELGLADTLGAPLVGTTTNGGATATASESAVWLVPLPHSYAGGALSVRVRAKVSAVRGTSATIDAVVKELADGAVGSDLVETAAQSINSTTYANKDFVVTPTGLAAGDTLVVQITAATNDTTAAVNGAANVAAVWLVLG